MDKRTGIIIGLSGALLYGLVRLLQRRTLAARQWHQANKHVDTASEDSFPASDPPSWSPVQSLGAPAEAR